MRVLPVTGLLVGVTLFVLAACVGEEEVSPEPAPSDQTTPAAPADGSSLTFETIETGDQSGIALEQPQLFKIETQAQWEQFWSQHRANVIPAPDLPQVDFPREMVIAAVDQDEPSGGFGFEITDIEDVEGRLVVRVRKDVPGPDCVVTAVITQPFHIVRTVQSDLQPELAISEETYSCG